MLVNATLCLLKEWCTSGATQMQKLQPSILNLWSGCSEFPQFGQNPRLFKEWRQYIFFKWENYTMKYCIICHILAFKILGLHLSAPFWVRGGLKSSSGHYKSTFRNINNLQCKKAAPAITVAFLTLMTLKLENKEIYAKLTSNDQVNMKKLSKLEFSGVWPLIWPFRPSSAFYNFFEILGT